MVIPPAQPCSWRRWRMTAAETWGAISSRRAIASVHRSRGRGRGLSGRWGGERREMCAAWGGAGPGAWRSYAPQGPHERDGGAHRWGVGPSCSAPREVRRSGRMVAGSAGALWRAVWSGLAGGSPGWEGRERTGKRGPAKTMRAFLIRAFRAMRASSRERCQSPQMFSKLEEDSPWRSATRPKKTDSNSAW